MIKTIENLQTNINILTEYSISKYCYNVNNNGATSGTSLPVTEPPG